MGWAFQEREERLQAFEEQYQDAWLASGQPDELAALEILLQALGDENPQPEVASLWAFFRTCLQERIPLNWVHQYHPESVEGITRAMSMMRTRISILDVLDQE